jgi:hypothetical protein
MTDINPPATPDEVPIATPLEGLDVNVRMPIPEVRMVNANALDEYQHWFGWASIFGAAAVGFGVPAIQSFQTGTNATLIAISVVFSGFFGRAALRTRKLRAKIESESYTHKMSLKASDRV